MCAGTIEHSTPTTPTSRIALLGERVAFAGKLATMTREEAAKLIDGCGGRAVSNVNERTTMLVVGMQGWPLRTGGHLPAKLEAAERLKASGKRIAIVSETAFRERVGLDPATDLGEKPLEATSVAAALGVETRVLQRWEHLGLVRSCGGKYDFRDLVSLRTVTDLVARGVSPSVIRESLAGLAGLVPGVDRPLAQLKILVSSSGTLVAELEHALLAPGGQLELKFGARPETEPEREGAASLRLALAGGDDAEELVERGLRAEAEGNLAGAEREYERAMAADPMDASPPFNLGNILLAREDFAGAAERFRQALQLDPSHTRALFNLAHVEDAMGDHPAAIKTLRRAVAADPAFADAHFNLADLLERSGQMTEAQRAWEKYLELDRAGPWADEARRRLNWTRSPAWA